MGLILVTASAIAWSTAGYFTRLIHLDTWTLLLWRGVFASLGLFSYLVIVERKAGLASFRKLGKGGWLFVLFSVVGMICMIASLKLTSVAHASVIYATVPLISAALAWWVMRERMARSTLVASLVALAGVALMMSVGQEGSWTGDLLALAMTFCMAILIVIARQGQNVPMVAAACLSALFSAMAVAPLAMSNLPDPQQLMLLCAFGLTNSALGLVLFAIGSKMLPAAETALIGALDAPLAPIWVLLAFGEVPNAATVIGGTLVFAAVLARMLWGSGWARRKAPA
jgi:drug/metabolite transporter (DMT)-like permease